MANSNVGLIALAVAIVIAAYLTAMSHRYQPAANNAGFVPFDSWTGQYSAK